MELSTSLDSAQLDRAIGEAERAMETGEHPAIHNGLEAAAGAYLTFVRGRYQAYADGSGNWAPLARSTIEGKFRRGASLRIGFDAGDLYASLSPGGPDNILQVDGMIARAGTENPHAGYFNDGTTRMPGRPFIVYPDGETMAEINRVLGDAFRRMLLATMGLQT